LLTPMEKLTTARAIEALQSALTSNDKDLIQKTTAALNETSRPYAERAMDEAVSGALKGKSINE